MNPSPYKRCLLILVDGARPDVLERELRAGFLPNIEASLTKPGFHSKLVTSFPSTTGPAYLPYLTGSHPGTLNVPGIRWFDRGAYVKHGWGFKAIRSYVGLETLLFNRDTELKTPSLYSYFQKPVSIMNMVKPGLKAAADGTRFSRVPVLLYAHLTNRWDRADAVTQKALLKAIDQDSDFIFAVFPAVDEFSHRISPLSPRVQQAYREVDAHLGEAFELLKKKGQWEETLVVIVADHGLSDTHTHFDVGPHVESRGLKTLYHSNIFKFNFEAVSMVSGNGMSHLYFKNKKGWGERTGYEELKSVDLLDELRGHPSVDVVACTGENGAIHLLTERGHAWFESSESGIVYHDDGKNPLGLDLPSGTSLSWDASYTKTIESHYPDIFMQLTQVFRSPRTGDVIVSAKTGHDLRIKFEHPLHKASHGSLCPEHMLVPFITNHKITGPAPKRAVDVFPFILRLMGKEVPAGIDGI